MKFEKKYKSGRVYYKGINGKHVEHKQPEKYKSKAKLILNDIDISQWISNKQTIERISNKDMIPIPGIGEIVRIRTQQQINLITIIVKLLEKFSRIDELTIATYTLNNESLAMLIGLKNKGKIKKMNLLIASSYSFRDKEYYLKIKRLCIENSVSLTFAWIHMKITLARIGENYFQFEGSMNYSTNNMVEQLLFENNKALYEHDYDFIASLKNSDQKALDIVVEC